MNRVMRQRAHNERLHREGDEIPHDAPNGPGGTEQMKPNDKAKPSGDPFPAAARARLLRLKGEADDCRDAAASATRRVGELRKGIDYTTERPPENADAINLEIARLDGVRSVQDRRHRDLAELVAHLDEWLRRQPRHIVFEEARVVERVSPNEGESIPQAIERLRREIDNTQAVLRHVEMAPPPKAILKAQAEAQIEALAKQGTPQLTITPEGISVKFRPKEYTPNFGMSAASDNGGVPFASNSPEFAAALLAFLHPAILISRVWKIIDGLPENKNAMTVERKRERLADIRGNLQQLERWECSMVDRANDEGIEVSHRVDADARAVLGIQVKTSKRAAA